LQTIKELFIIYADKLLNYKGVFMNLVNEVLANFQKIAKNKEVTLESNVKELGLDSLDIVDLLMDMEEKYNIEFENEEMTELVTVNDVVKAIESKLK
jgi:acyl carrier protein